MPWGRGGGVSQMYLQIEQAMVIYKGVQFFWGRIWRIKNRGKMRWDVSFHPTWAGGEEQCKCAWAELGGGKIKTTYCFKDSYNVNAVTLNCHTSFSVLFCHGLIIWISEHLVAGKPEQVNEHQREGGKKGNNWPKVKLNKRGFCHSPKLTTVRFRSL